MKSDKLFKSMAIPKAITMWDFSWLERRWPGAGYEDWDEALDGLVERGYDGVRIDAYPHLLAKDPEKEWELLPEWSTQDWGSPARCKVQVAPALFQFIRKCADRGIQVALSTWFREDVSKVRLCIPTPKVHAEIWVKTLRLIEEQGLLDSILYVDLCNEWPFAVWAPFFQLPENEGHLWSCPKSMQWMNSCITHLRREYPDLFYCFSFASELQHPGEPPDLSFMDLLDLHIWMANSTDFYERVGYKFERFDSVGYENVVARAEQLYRADPEHWQSKLVALVEGAADWASRLQKPLVTTECWGIVDYKDWPGLDWGWVKELCEVGVRTAVQTGQWKAISTSNFCGPQFVGMWRDIEWHQRLTKMIRQGV